MNRLVPLVAATVFALAPKSGASQQDFSDVVVRPLAVAPSVHMLQGSGGNIGVLVGPDGTLIVDDQYAPLTDRIVAAIAALTDEPVRYVVNTHWHYDHSGGNENFGRLGAAIVAHENSRVRMLSPQYVLVGNVDQAPYAAEGLPQITFDEAIRFHYNGQTIDLFYLGPAHTDGDAVVHFRQANVVHTGDVFVRYGLPFIDQQNGGDIDGMIRVVNAVIALSDAETAIIPGHGDLATRDDLVSYAEMLQTLRDRIQGLIAQGRSLSEIVASNPTEGYQGNGERFVTAVYNSLVGRSSP
jgi:glyoxylase-like metal-dependent hydrolase (beta-lactamase superfamily II)